MTPGVAKLIAMIEKAVGSIGPTTVFVAVNGLVASAVVFLTLHFMTGDPNALDPYRMAQVLAALPWMALGLIVAMTVAAALLVQRRHAQEEKIAEMSKTLEGTHSELKSKISERDRLFHTLRRSEREHRALINSVSDVIFETDEQGRFVFLNESWHAITGQEIDDSLGKYLFALIDANDKEAIQSMFHELVGGRRQSFRTETRLETLSGIRAVEITFSMLRMSEDKGLRVVGTMTDIEKRRRAESALRDAERRYRAIVENSISGIYQISPEGSFIGANPAMAELLGYNSPEDLVAEIGDVFQQLYARPEERRALVDKLMLEGRVTGVETEIFRRDGTRLWVIENLRVARDEKGRLTHYEGNMWDITERRRAEEAMQQARLQAEISSRSRMEFLANMGHELRTPLNAVIGFSEIIKDEVMGPVGVEAYKEYAKDIYNSGNALMKVIGEILEVSRIETGNRELNISSFSLQKSVQSCLAIMGSRIEKAGVDVQVDLPEDLPHLVAEELGFKQILLNLLSNAVKFTPKGGQITLAAHMEPSGEMVIDVTDTGIGMTAEEVEKAMQPFGQVQTALSRDNAGTGLGLTIVESLVRLHGGHFRLISQKDVGTTARVVLPAARVMQDTGNVVHLPNASN